MSWRKKVQPAVNCAACGAAVSGNAGLNQHIHRVHGVHPQAYYDVYDDNPCANCGKKISFLTVLGRIQTLHKKFCSNSCSRLANGYNPEGHIDKHGYIRVAIRTLPKRWHSILLPMGHPRGFIKQHRAFMAIKLRRTLKPNETVHHKNGNRADNRLSNLELHVGHHGSGASASALKCPHCGKKYLEKIA